jgi:hypothetical protein
VTAVDSVLRCNHGSCGMITDCNQTVQLLSLRAAATNTGTLSNRQHFQPFLCPAFEKCKRKAFFASINFQNIEF